MDAIILVVPPHQFETYTTCGCVSLALIALLIIGYFIYSILRHENL